MHNCSLRSVPVTKGERISKDQCPKNDKERMEMKNVRYSSAVGVLGRFMSNLGLIHYQGVKKVFRYLQGTKYHMLTYRCTNSINVVGYSDANFKRLCG